MNIKQTFPEFIFKLIYTNEKKQEIILILVDILRLFKYAFKNSFKRILIQRKWPSFAKSLQKTIVVVKLLLIIIKENK